MLVSVDLESLDKRFTYPQCKHEKISDNEIAYQDLYYVMTITDCCSNKIQMNLSVKNKNYPI